MIGIIGAMSVEVDIIKQRIDNKKSTNLSGIEFVSGTIYGKDVVVAVCGIGKVFAAICAQTMILRFGVDMLINTGVGGSLVTDLCVGDIAIATDVVQHDMDTSPLGDPTGLVSGINIINFPCNKKMVKLVEDCVKRLKLNYKKGTIASGDQFINSKEKKHKIFDNFGAVVAEMEGGSVGHVCYVNRVDFTVIRAISDNADGDSNIDFETFAKDAAKKSATIVTDFIKNI